LNPERREFVGFTLVLALLLVAFFSDCLLTGKILSPADVVLRQNAFKECRPDPNQEYEPLNRLLIDPVLQFQPWLEFNRAEFRAGRIPLWNPYAGCGTPHLANSQNAAFDPFHLVAYLGNLPDVYVWMAALRLAWAGWGMFLLARAWGYGPWGRWFCGLVYPFCGFLILWLLYPVTSVAIWLPWMVWASHRLISRPSARGVALLALCAGASALAGHVQTTLHVGMWAGIWVLYHLFLAPAAQPPPLRSRIMLFLLWITAILLGIALAAVSLLPLGAYLSRSPIWADRLQEHPPWWVVPAPRLLEAFTTAIPYLYGSQRAGHPNLARALNLQNINESAGGFTGILTLACLAPFAVLRDRNRSLVRFLCAMLLLSVLGAFQWPPVSNLLRALPLLRVVDHRRLTLWIAFTLILLAGRGLDALVSADRIPRAWKRAWIISALLLACVGIAIGFLGPAFREHIAASAKRQIVTQNPPGEPSWSNRIGPHLDRCFQAMPFILGFPAIQLAALGISASLWSASRCSRGQFRATVLGLVLIDLFCFGRGYNPAIPRELDRPISPLIQRLRQVAPPPARILPIGEELPPNILMRYGLADIRNYDSIELKRILDYFETLYETSFPPEARSSRRPITWKGVVRALDRLRDAGVAVIVASTPPPPYVFSRVESLGPMFLAFTDAASPRIMRPAPGEIRIDRMADSVDPDFIPETFDPGWKAVMDGQPGPAIAARDTFLALTPSLHVSAILWRYDPVEFRAGALLSLFAGAATLVLLLRGPRSEKSPGGFQHAEQPVYDNS
jgi:hypothetical protein